jgi:hypothetical protein
MILEGNLTGHFTIYENRTDHEPATPCDRDGKREWG